MVLTCPASGPDAEFSRYSRADGYQSSNRISIIYIYINYIIHDITYDFIFYFCLFDLILSHFQICDRLTRWPLNDGRCRQRKKATGWLPHNHENIMRKPAFQKNVQKLPQPTASTAAKRLSAVSQKPSISLHLRKVRHQLTLTAVAKIPEHPSVPSI